MGNPKASSFLTPENVWWGFMEDEELVASVNKSAAHFGCPEYSEEDLIQEAYMWLATRKDDYYRGSKLAALVDQKMRDWTAKGRAYKARVQSWREWNDQWD